MSRYATWKVDRRPHARVGDGNKPELESKGTYWRDSGRNVPRTCLSLLGLGEAARAAVQVSFVKRKMQVLKSFRMVGHWYIEWGLVKGRGSRSWEQPIKIPEGSADSFQAVWREEVGGQQRRRL